MTWRFPRWTVAAAMAISVTPAVAHEIRQGDGVETAAAGLPDACRAMSGNYAVAPLADTAEFSGLVGEYIDPEYIVGQPAFALQVDAEAMTRTGAISKETTELRMSEQVASQGLFGEAPIGCVLSDAADNGDMQLVHVDLSELPTAQLQGLADYLDRFWNSKVDLDALRKTQDFVVVDQSMIGVANFYFLIPLRKI